MRLLRPWHDHVGERAAGSQSAADRRQTCARRSPGIFAVAAPTHASFVRCCARRTRTGGHRAVNAPVFNRREFTTALGALVVAFSLDPRSARGQERLPGSLRGNRRLDAWIRINADGSATVFTGKVELGQGILTALAQIAAEELDLPLSRVEM